MKPNCHVCGKFVGIIIAEAIGFGWIWMDLDGFGSCSIFVPERCTDAPTHGRTRQGLSGPLEEAG